MKSRFLLISRQNRLMLAPVVLPQQVARNTVLHLHNLNSRNACRKRLFIGTPYQDTAITIKVDFNTNLRDLWISEIEYHLLNIGVAICHFISPILSTLAPLPKSTA